VGGIFQAKASSGNSGSGIQNPEKIYDPNVIENPISHDILSAQWSGCIAKKLVILDIRYVCRRLFTLLIQPTFFPLAFKVEKV
jgi:hypothetical protein